MKKRLAVVAAGLLAGLMALGTANALVLETAPGTETATSEVAVAGAETVYEVGDAGTVTITNDGSLLEIVSVNQTDGWQIEIETATGREVEVDFRMGTRRIQFNAELEGGEIRVRARERVITATTQATTSTTQGATASTVAVAEQIGTVTYEAGAAGSVTISNDGSRLTIVDVDAADGWSHEIEVQVGREVEMDFRKGEDRVQFNAEFEDGEIRVRVRTRTADGTRTEVTNGVDTTDDDAKGSDDDNSGSNSGSSSNDEPEDSDDDNSSSNSGSSSNDEPEDSDDDNSGRGGSNDDDHESSDD